MRGQRAMRKRECLLSVLLFISLFFYSPLYKNLFFYDFVILAVVFLALKSIRFIAIVLMALFFSSAFWVLSCLYHGSGLITLSWFLQFLYGVIGSLALFFYFSKKNNLQLLYKVFALGVLGYALLGIVSFFYQDMAFSGFIVGWKGRLGTSTLLPNDLAIIFVFGLALFGVVEWRNESIKVAAFFVLSFAVVLTFSRSGILSLAFLMILSPDRNKTKALCVFSVLLVAVFFFFSSDSFDRIGRLSMTSISLDGESGRMKYFLNAISSLRESFVFPYWGYAGVQDRAASSVHNYYLSLLVNLGVLGLVGVLLIVFSYAVIVMTSYRVLLSVVPSFMLSPLMVNRLILFVFFAPLLVFLFDRDARRQINKSLYMFCGKNLGR